MANKSFVIQYVIKAREQYSEAARRVAKSSDKMRLSVDKAKKSFASFSASAKRGGAILTAAATVPILLMAKSLKNAARDGSESRSKFKAIFKGITQSAEGTADKLAKEYGLAGVASRDMLSNTGGLLKGYGMTEAAALKVSERVQQLAVDMDSFQNFSGGAVGASEAITAALLGETERMKGLQVSINQDLVKKKAQMLAANGARFSSEQQAKAMATLALILEQSKDATGENVKVITKLSQIMVKGKDAIGDYERTSEGLANQEKKTAAAIADLIELMGRELEPIALKLTKAIRGVTEKVSAMSPEMRKTIMVVAGIIAVLGPLLLLVAGIGLVIPLITAGFAALGVVAAVVFSPIGLAVMAIAAGAFLIIKNWEKVKTFLTGFGKHAYSRLVQPFIDMKNKVMDIINAIKNFDFSSVTFDDIKAQFFGGETKPDLSGGSKIDVGLNVGLDKGLVQKEAPNVSTRKSRRGDVGFALAGA